MLVEIKHIVEGALDTLRFGARLETVRRMVLFRSRPSGFKRSLSLGST